ncbi:MAG TPA: HEAT repeat domain-containing protein [Vicinamibacterales bacterium]|nr:HEAT repeat domain-containing protein [Vicinamibacterales bacterium]
MLMHWNSPESKVQSPTSWVVVAVLTVLLVGSGFSRTVTAQQYTFEEVAAGLRHQDAPTRLRAIQILKDADYADAAEPIAAALEDVDDRVQLAAIDAERSLFTTRPVSRRRKVGFVLEVRSVSGGDVEADGQLALKARAVPARVLAGLAVALRDSNPQVRGEAINLTSLLAPVSCALPMRLKQDQLCSQIGNALIDNINSRVPLLRRSSMQALGRLRYANAVQALSDQLSFYQRGPDGLAALEGLAGVGHPTSASIFKQMLTSSNAEMRRLAVEGLARAGERDALPALQQMGQSERSNRVLLALHYASLTLGSTASVIEQLVAGLGIAAQRPLSLKYLLDLAPSMAPALAASLRDESPDVRRTVADLLGFSRDAKIISALEAATKDVDPDVAAAAQQAIDRIKIL